MAPPFKFQSIVTGNQILDRIQNLISNAFNSIVGPFLGGNLIQNVQVGSSATVIHHGLGRQPELWVICDQNTNTNVWRTAWSSTSITLQAGSACVISLWVN